MPVTVISRPIGHKLGTSDVSASIIDSSGEALVYTGTGHGLSDGDYVFIESNFESYNGFKYVDSVSYDSFKLKTSEGGDYVPFKQNANITYRISALDHGWQCVHLPIVYELESDLYRVNTVEDSYTPRVISFAANSNGYTALQGSLNFININSLDYVELIGDGPLAGVYQVINYIDPDEITINLPWNADNVFTGYELRKYYNNYSVNVYVYAGLPEGHPWEDEKPYELAATLKLTPDSNNRIKFSISEILKGYVQTRNNLTLDTLPNNIDFVTAFKISYSEVYDTSNGTVVESEEQSVVEDSFEGYATNSMLPFKSLNAGHMSDYIGAGSLTSRWLTLQDRPVAFVDRFFDLSFINRHEDANIIITIFKSYQGITTDTEVIEYNNVGIGIIRVPITPEAGFDLYCIRAAYEPINNDPVYTTIGGFALQTGSGDSWSLGASPTVTSSSSTKMMYVAFATIAGRTYNITSTFDMTHDPGAQSQLVIVGFLDSGLNVDVTSSDSMPGTGTQTATNTIVATGDSVYLFIKIDPIAGTSADYEFISLTVEEMPDDVEDMEDTTEQICIDVVEDCSTFVSDDNLRLTEGGNFRELE